jgi:hypothetical protein
MNGSIEGKGLEELRLLAEQGADGTRLAEQAYRAVFGASPRFSHREWGKSLRRPHRELRPPHRDRGCPGMLRYSDTQHAVPLTECDVCGYEIGVGR